MDPRRAAVWAVLFAVLVRAVFLLQLREMPYFDLELSAFDEINFHRGALALSQGDWRAPSPNELYSPLYKYGLGALYAAASPFTDLRIGAARTAQLALGVLVAWGVFRLGRACLSVKAGLAASLLYSAFGPALFMEAKLLREFPASAALLFALCAAAGGRPLASAALLSVACQFRSNLLLVTPVLLWHAWRAPGDPSRRLRASASWAAVFLAVLLPSLVRNAVVLGSPALRPPGSLPAGYPEGKPLWTLEPQGPLVMAVGNYPFHAEPEWMDSEAQPPELRAYGVSVEPSFGRTLRMVLGWMASSPGGFLRHQLRKAYWTLWDGEVPSNHSFYLWQRLAPVLALPLSHFGILAAVALAGFCLASARRQVPLLVWLSLAAVLCGVSLAHPAGRFRAPAYPLLALACAGVGRAAWGWMRERRWGPVLRLGGLAGAAALLLGPPEPALLRSLLGIPRPHPRSSLLRGIDEHNLTIAYRLGGRLEEAERVGEACWNRSLKERQPAQDLGAFLDRDLYPALVEALAGKGEALPALEAALRWECVSPGSPRPHVWMSRLLKGEPSRLAALRARVRGSGDAPRPPPEGDEARLLDSLLKDPGSIGAHRELARLYRARGMPQRAALHVQAAEGRVRVEDLSIPLEIPEPWLRWTLGP